MRGDIQIARLLDRALTIATLLLGLTAIAVLAQPTSWLRVGLREWKLRRDRRETLATDWPNVSTNVESVLGTPGGSVGLVEFVDYECEACRQSYYAVDSILTSIAGASVAIRHLPPPRHPLAAAAARAAICAGAAGRFPAMHALLLESVSWYDYPEWSALAMKVGVTDTAEFNRCLTSREVEARLAEDLRLAKQLLLRGTPAFVGRHGVLEGSVSAKALSHVMDAGSKDVF